MLWWTIMLLHNWWRPTLKVEMLSVPEHATSGVVGRWPTRGQVVGRHRASRVAVALLATGCLVGDDLVFMGFFIEATRATVRMIAYSASSDPFCYLLELLVAIAGQSYFRVHRGHPILASRASHHHLDNCHISIYTLVSAPVPSPCISVFVGKNSLKVVFSFIAYLINLHKYSLLT